MSLRGEPDRRTGETKNRRRTLECDPDFLAARGTRRGFLRQSAALAAATFAMRHGARVSAAPIAPEALRLSTTMVTLIGPDANSVAAAGEEGIVLVDGGSASWSDALLTRVADTFAQRPIRALLNTHWHEEHTGSNVVLGERGVEIVAHENTKLWLGTEVRVRWSGKTYAPLPAPGLPTTTLYESSGLQLGSVRVDCRYLMNAHTDGDLCVYFPDENVLVAGGAVSNDGWPLIDWWTGGWLGGMLDGYESLLSIANSDTRIVPSRGPLMSLADLRAQHEMYLAIFDRLQSMLRQSFSPEEVLAARPTAEFDARWGDPTRFVTLAFHSLWGHLRDVYDTRLRNIP